MGKSDVNKIDFLGIEAVRVFAPRFYDAIPANKGIFVETLESIATRNDTQAATARRTRYEELLNTLIPDEIVRKSIDGICQELFPQLDRNGSRSSEEWERDLRICSPDRFNFYFQLGIPYGEISETEIDEVVASLASTDSFKVFILRFKEEKRLRKVLAKLLQRRNALNEAQLKIALSVLWELEKEITDEKEAVFDLDDIGYQVLRIGYHGLKELAQDKRKPLLADIIQASKNIYSPLHLVAIIQQDFEKETARAGVSFVSESELKELEQLLVDKIKMMAVDGSLIKERHLPLILYRWRDWESPEAVTKYIRELVNTREGFLTFLKSFVGKTLSSAGNYNDLNRNSIAGLYPITEIEALVAAVTDEELIQMTLQEKEAVELFRNPPRRW